MKISKEMKQEITAAMKARNFGHHQKNGIDQYINKAIREGVELKGDKIDAFVIDDDNEQVYGLQLIGNEARDAIKELQKILNVDFVAVIKEPEPKPKNEIVPVLETMDSWELSNELIANHPGTLPVLIAMQQTPPGAIKTRKGRGVSELKYVDTGYMTFCLNYAALMDWDFEILESEIDTIEDKMHISVLGCLTMRTTEGKVLQKTQWGSQVLKAGSEMGDMRKAAASDALKKCGSMLGIAQDVYGGVV